MFRTAVGAGLLAGASLELVAWLVARHGPAGDSWSFRGNGALVVPLGLGPAMLAAAWTTLVLRARAHPRWWVWGSAAALVGAALVAASVAALVLFGRAAQGLSDALTVPILVWPVLAPLLAAARSGGCARSWQRPRAHAAAAVTFAAALVTSFAAAGYVLPAGS
ncbi:MAG TPA: hypothetical protein VFX49_06165 [Chloroflexota bacterium]|nr:hypothetical protein [Chloroflexota bacterium]